MKTRFLIIIGIVAGIIVLGILVSLATPTMRDASQFEYDKSCFTQFWTETIKKPNQSHIKDMILEQLKERIQWVISPDEITFYDQDSEFVVNIPGDWKGRSPIVIVVKETLENIDEITSVKSIKIICA